MNNRADMDNSKVFWFNYNFPDILMVHVFDVYNFEHMWWNSPFVKVQS